MDFPVFKSLHNVLQFTLSKALVTSRKHTNILPLSEGYNSMIYVKVYIHWSVPCFPLKPKWLELVLGNSSILIRRIILMTLLNTLIIENGRLLSLDAILLTFSLSTGSDTTENIVP